MLKRILFFSLLLLLGNFESFATHILGGELTYKYLGSNGPADKPFRYSIHFVGYVDRIGTTTGIDARPSNWACGNLDSNPRLAIYDAGSLALLRKDAFNGTYALPTRGAATRNCPFDPYYGGMRPLVIPVPPSCIVPGISDLGIAITDTTFEVQLPLSASGYKIKYENRARTDATTNIFFPGGSGDPGNTWLATIPSPIFVNSSPQFIGDAVPFFCLGDTTTISNNAFDPDGDRLIYSFATPYSDDGINGNPNGTYIEPRNVIYKVGYSQLQPFGANGFASINPSTGLTRYYSAEQGQFAVAVDIKEYRTLSNGTEILLSTTRREFLVVVKACAPNPPPKPLTVSSNVTLIKNEGDSVVFTAKAFDIDTTEISAASELLVPGNNTGSLATCPDAIGKDTVATVFKWKIDCGITKGQPRAYSVQIKYQDRGCPPKSETVVYTIVVNPFKAPVLSGKDSLCSTGNALTLSAPAGSIKKWQILEGNINGSSTGNSVNVSFPGDTARLKLVVTSGSGCKDSVSKTLNKIQFVPIIATAPSNFVCQDSAINLSAAGGYNSVSWSPATGLNSTSSRNPIASVIDTVSYIVTSNGPAGCVAKDTISLNWIPRIANAGSDSILCSGLKRGIGGAQATAYTYYSYQWLPNIGLGSDTSFRTIATLANSGTGNQSFTFVQRALHRASNCLSTDTVKLFVKPLPIVNAGPDTATICSGSKTLIGTKESKLALYQWTPVTGITSQGTDTTTLSLNPDSINVKFYKYFLKKTEVILNPIPGDPACTNVDSITLKVNPLPFFALAAKDSICSGFSTTIGTASQAGFSYNWSPVNGLSNANSATTNIRLLNLNQLPQDTLYKLLVTNEQTNCTRDKSINVKVNPLPNVDAGIDTGLCSGDSIRIGESLQNGFSYIWTPSFGLNNATFSAPKISLINPITGGNSETKIYKLVKTNKQSTCKNADSLRVEIKPLPTAFAFATDTATVCSKSILLLGTNALRNHIYNWQPDTSVSSFNISNPVLNINNPSQLARFLIFKINVTNLVTSCKNSDSVVVKINPLPIVPLTYSDTAVCSRSGIQIGGAATDGYSYTWSPKVYLSDSTKALTDFVSANNTDVSAEYSYKLSVKIDATNCMNNKSLRVEVNPLPDANAGPDKEVCSKDSIQIGVPDQPGRKYSWFPISGLSNPNISNPKLALVNNGTTNSTSNYTLSVTDLTKSTLCDSTDAVTVTVKPLPNVVAASTDSFQICATVDLGLGINGDPGLDYNWSPIANLSSGIIANPIFKSSIGNLQQLYVLTATNPASLCKKSDSVKILVNALPIVNAGILDSLCSGDTIQIGPGTALSANYLWSPMEGLSSTNSINPKLTLVNNGNAGLIKPYQLKITNPITSCADSITLNVKVNPLPRPDAGLDRTICSGDVTEIGALSQLGFDYNWKANNRLSFLNISNPGYRLVQTGAPSTDTLIVKMTNKLTQCKKSDSVFVRTNPRPIGMAFGLFSPTVCPFTKNVNYSVINSIPGNTYSWSVSGGLQVSGANTNAITVDWNGSNANAKLVAIPTNVFGCVGVKDSIQLVLNQNLKPTTPFGDSILCSDFKVAKLYSTIPTPGSNYTWKMLEATVDSTITANGNTEVDWEINNGIGKIWIQEQSSTIDPGTGTPVACYGRSDTLKVEINPSPDSTLKISGDSSVCGSSQNEASLALNGNVSSTFTWQIKPVANIKTGQGTDSLVVNWNTPGIYLVSVVESSNKACVGKSITKQVEVNAKPKPELLTLTNLNICPNDLQKGYFAKSGPGFVNSKFNWTISGGTASTPIDQDFLGVNWGSSGSYQLVLTETTNKGCKNDSILPLFYDPSEVKLQNVSLLEIDENQVELIFSMGSGSTNNSSISIWRRELNDNPGPYEKIKSDIPKNVNSYLDQPGNTGNTIFQYMVSTKNVCDRTVESFPHNTILLKVVANDESETAKLDWNPYSGWENGVNDYTVLRKLDAEPSLRIFEDGLEFAGKPEASYRVGTDGFEQCWRVIANEGGEGFKSFSNPVCVKFENQLGFFSMITPNGDNKNDKFEIKNLQLYPENELFIFDRWGKKVLQKKNYNNSDLWAGNNLEEGVFFYRFLVPNRSKDFNGWVVLKRN